MYTPAVKTVKHPEMNNRVTQTFLIGYGYAKLVPNRMSQYPLPVQLYDIVGMKTEMKAT